MMTDSTIAFIGLGLIGGSIAPWDQARQSGYHHYGLHADPFQTGAGKTEGSVDVS